MKGNGTLRISLVVDQLGFCGTELQFAQLAAGLAEAGLATQFIVLKPPSGVEIAQASDLRTRGVSVESADSVRSRGWARDLWRIKRLTAQHRPEIVHAAMSRSMALVAAPNVLPPHVPRIGSRRSLVSDRTDGFIGSRIRTLSARRAGLLIANSTAVALDSSRVEGIPLERFRVIGNILNRRTFEDVAPARIESQRPILLSVANLREPKNHLGLLEASATLASRGLMTTIVCVGAGPLREELEVRAAALALDVRFVGAVADPRPYLAAADIFVQPSLTEGLSNSLLEAMAAELPIVATNVGGTEEALGAAGILVRSGDTLEMAGALEYLLTNSDAASALGKSARTAARSFSLEAATSRHIEVYNEALVAAKQS